MEIEGRLESQVAEHGNGSSAADGQHLVAELVRCRTNRKAISVIALTTDTSPLAALGNHFVFASV